MLVHRYTRKVTRVYRGTRDTFDGDHQMGSMSRHCDPLQAKRRCIGLGIRLSSSPYCLLFGSDMLLGPSVSAVLLPPYLSVPVPLQIFLFVALFNVPCPSSHRLRRSCAGINAYVRDTMYPGAL